jgi:hypothetical protein
MCVYIYIYIYSKSFKTSIIKYHFESVALFMTTYLRLAFILKSSTITSIGRMQVAPVMAITSSHASFLH